MRHIGAYAVEFQWTEAVFQASLGRFVPIALLPVRMVNDVAQIVFEPIYDFVPHEAAVTDELPIRLQSDSPSAIPRIPAASNASFQPITDLLIIKRPGPKAHCLGVGKQRPEFLEVAFLILPDEQPFVVIINISIRAPL